MATPNAKNIRNLSGWLYVRPLDKNYFTNVGHVESVNRNLAITRENIFGSGSGTRQKLDVHVTETGGTLSIVLRETTAFNFALANASDTDVFHTQDADTFSLQYQNVKAGDVISLGFMGITSVQVTELVQLGQNDLYPLLDYRIDTEAGVIEVLRDVDIMDVMFDAPAIAEADRLAKIALLQRPEGITCEILVVQKQKRGATRYKFEKAIATFFPEGDLTLIKEDPAAVTITLMGEMIPNPNVPEAEQYGVMIELPATA